MTPRLDRNKPYGEVIPSGLLWQDGHYFYANGSYSHSQGAEEPKADPVEPGRVEAVPDAPVSVDLAAWAKGEAKYPHFKVAKTVQDAYPDAEFAKNRAGMIELLIAKGIVSEIEAVR